MDSAEIPRLSKSIALTLLSECPLLAWREHRLLGGMGKEQTAAMSEGLILEALICGGPIDRIAVISAPDFRTKAAQEARDQAILDGLAPVLAYKFDVFKRQANIIREKIEARAPHFFEAEPQVRFEWEADGCACSGVLDALYLEEWAYKIFDLKDVRSVNPKSIVRDVVKYGWDIQAAAYTEAVEKTYGKVAGRGSFQFIAFQLDPIPMVQTFRLSGEFAHIGKRKWDYAKTLWQYCLRSDEWPGYGDGEIVLEPKPWQAIEADEFVVTSELEDL